MHSYAASLQSYKRLPTREVKVGNLVIGGNNPIRIQTMTTTDTMDTEATVAQTIRCIQAGAELVRITAPSKNEAENLKIIKEQIKAAGYTTPLVADIHFTPNAAEIAATLIEKVRVNPGNYVDKKKFEQIEYSEAEYAEEIERIRQRFTPLVEICKVHGTAMRIGTNHGSLSDRIMSRYGDTANGMVESAMEFLRIARSLNYHQVILSMKSSNPLVMVQAYRLLVVHMLQEFGECYPLHLGVTEAGDAEDGRIKSAIGIGTLLEDGIGDTIRVSLTEDPEFEIPVCKDLIERYAGLQNNAEISASEVFTKHSYSPFEYYRRRSIEVINIGGSNVPVVFADFMQSDNITPGSLNDIGYAYDPATDKWNIADAAADYIYGGKNPVNFKLPGTLSVVYDAAFWATKENELQAYPLFYGDEFLSLDKKSDTLNFVSVEVDSISDALFQQIKSDPTVVLCIYSAKKNAMQRMRFLLNRMQELQIATPVIIAVESMHKTVDEQLIHFSATSGGLFLDGFGDGLWLINDPSQMVDQTVTGRTYLPVNSNRQFLNNTSFSILQAVRTRISKTEYISCPSCGRTLFDLQETTASIRRVTSHLKGLKIAIMGCIVNGPGEMADADFGYVGSGPGKITLYKGREVMKKNVPSEVAVSELIQLLKDNDVWIEAGV